MPTATGSVHAKPEIEAPEKRKWIDEVSSDDSRWKKPRAAATAAPPSSADDYLGKLPDDLVISILCNLSSSACWPSDIVSITMTCKRLNRLGLDPLVLSKASPKSLTIRARNWSDEAQQFLMRCSDAGNLEASYILGMIKFYCLRKLGSGASQMAKAAVGSHAGALYSLAVIQFNGSGGRSTDKNFNAGIRLLARAAFLGYVDGLRELGHCLQDGYGVRKNVAEGRRFLIWANAKELEPQVASKSKKSSIFSDYGCNVGVMEAHPANKFLIEWFGARPIAPELRLCSYVGCGRPEMRKHEFRRCVVCGKVYYCSRACQALHWKLLHKAECAPPIDVAVQQQDAAP